MPLYEQTMFLMKSKIFLLITGCFAVLLTSCLGDSDYDSYYEVDKNCQITEFSLSSDSVSGLSDVKFTIDQLNGRIMNLDSMPFGTEIEKVICTVKYGSYVTKLEVIQEATGDTIDWNAEDSLDFSKPVKFITSSYDGMTKRVYVAQVNVHQVVPDSMVWRQYTTNMLPTKFVDQKVISFNDGSADYYNLRPIRLISFIAQSKQMPRVGKNCHWQDSQLAVYCFHK